MAGRHGAILAERDALSYETGIFVVNTISQKDDILNPIHKWELIDDNADNGTSPF